MKKFRSKCLAYTLAVTLGVTGMAGSSVAVAYDVYGSGRDEVDTGDMVADALVVRPISAVATAVGALIWVVGHLQDERWRGDW